MTVSYTHLDVYKRQLNTLAGVSFIYLLTAWCVFCPRTGFTGHVPSMLSYPRLVSSFSNIASVYRLSSGLSSVLYSDFHLPSLQYFCQHITSQYLMYTVSQPISLPALDDIQHSFSLVLFQASPHLSLYASRQFFPSFLLRVHISKGCNLLFSSILNIQVSTLHPSNKAFHHLLSQLCVQCAVQ